LQFLQKLRAYVKLYHDDGVGDGGTLDMENCCFVNPASLKFGNQFSTSFCHQLSILLSLSPVVFLHFSEEPHILIMFLLALVLLFCNLLTQYRDWQVSKINFLVLVLNKINYF
jgi:hypothetical protein